MAYGYREYVSVDGVRYYLRDAEAPHPDTIGEWLEQNVVKSVLLDMFYPIGKLWISDDSTNPGNIVGGTWTPITERFILAAGSHYPALSEGGSANAVVVAHDHTTHASIGDNGSHIHAVSGTAASAGGHTHGLGDRWSSGEGNDSAYRRTANREAVVINTSTAGAHTHNISGTATQNGIHNHAVSVAVDSSGVSGVGKNMPPDHVSYVWKRIA